MLYSQQIQIVLKEKSCSGMKIIYSIHPVRKLFAVNSLILSVGLLIVLGFGFTIANETSNQRAIVCYSRVDGGEVTWPPNRVVRVVYKYVRINGVVILLSCILAI